MHGDEGSPEGGGQHDHQLSARELQRGQADSAGVLRPREQEVDFHLVPDSQDPNALCSVNACCIIAESL